MGGRVTLLKVIFACLPVYFLSLFQIPKTVKEELDRIQRRFLWGGSSISRKLHWVNWKSVCNLKKFGGLGIMDIGFKIEPCGINGYGDLVKNLRLCGGRLSAVNMVIIIWVLFRILLVKRDFRTYGIILPDHYGVKVFMRMFFLLTLVFCLVMAAKLDSGGIVGLAELRFR